MAEAVEPQKDGSARLSGGRAEFVASLARRLEALRAQLAALEAEPRSPTRRDGLLRRVHAMGAGAKVLGFAAVAEALSVAEAALQRSAVGREARPADLAEVSRAIEQLPSLVWGGAASVAPPPQTPEDRVWPLSVLAFGPSALGDALADSREGRTEVEVTDDLPRALELARAIGPDVVLIDADRDGAQKLAESVFNDPSMEPAPLVVIGTFETPEAASALVALGAARVLPKPVSPDLLRRSVLEVGRLATPARSVREPLGELTVERLAERISSEVRRGLTDAVELGARERTVALGDGTDVLAAVWAAVARVRELVTLRSSGNVRFDPSGPEGAIPLAPWTAPERRAGDRGARETREGDGVHLEKRRILVADDDPAVVWFLSGLVRAASGEPLEAHDGVRALGLACDAWPDVVVSDVLMPGLDGFSLCREIKRDVAIRDVPVILLSWKEDLLQRVRELGADADGYLRKEATGSTVLKRLREVLRPRARVEERLAAGGEVRGRLDGLTPRLVLQLSCERQPSSRVVIRDAAYLYEVQVREGRPYCATRTASDGSFERGENVLGALLGASAGRFVVTPETSRCRRDFDGSLEKVLAGPIRRARAAQRAVSAEALIDIEQIEIDEPAIAGYLAVSPEPARALVVRLLEGASPRQLLLAGHASPRLLEMVLSDIARHAGVVRVETGEGADLLERAAAELAKQAALPKIELPPTPSPTPMLNFNFIEGSPFPRGYAGSESPRLPLSRDVTPFATAANVVSMATGGTPGGMTLPGVGGGLPATTSAGPPEVSQAPAEPLEVSERPIVAIADPALRADVPTASIAAAALRADVPTVSIAAAALRAEVPTVATNPTPAAEGGMDLADAIVAAASSEPPPVAKVDRPPRPDPDKSSLKDQAGSTESEAEKPDAQADAEDEEDAEPDAKQASAPPWERSKPKDSAAGPDEKRPQTEDSSAPPSADTTQQTSADMPPTTPSPISEPAHSPALPAASGGSLPGLARSVPDSGPRKSDSSQRSELDRSSRPPRSSANPSRLSSRPPSVGRHSDKVPEMIPETRPDEQGGLSGVKLVLLTAAAAALSYLVVKAIVPKAEEPEPQSTPAVTQTAPTPPAAVKSVAPRPASLEPKLEDLPIPPGMVVPQDKGLLEVDTAGKHGIYVDGTFVGRGPLRQVPLAPGSHTVRAELDADQLNATVDVRQGRRSRLSFAAR